jgi:hypothetical protein
MSTRKEDIRTLILDSILTIFFLLFVLSVKHDSFDKTAGTRKQSVPTEITLNQSNADVYSCILFKSPPKNLFTEIKYPEDLRQSQKIFYENRKTAILISVQKVSVSEAVNIPDFVYCFHIFPSERDYIPKRV